MTASRIAWSAFRHAYAQPDQRYLEYESNAQRYSLLWGYYSSAVFDDPSWGSYKRRYRLYRGTRALYNPVRRLVDFYAGQVYPGIITRDARRRADGTPSAIPFDDDVAPAVTTAIAQLFQWSNWAQAKNLMVRYGAALGDVMVEIVDDADRGLVHFDVLWPGFVTELDLDHNNNVKAYTLEYSYFDDGDEATYTYKREVDGDEIRTYRDDKPFGYNGNEAAYPNPYGFAPAVWIKHTDNGSDHGDPAVRGISKVDELNSLATHALDQVHKILGAPLLISGENLRTLAGSDAANVTDGLEADTLNILRGSPDTAMAALRLDPGESIAHMEQLLAEIERDHPELSMFAQLRSMSEVTGPAADRMFGDVSAYVDEARTSYDLGSIKLFQMGLAIAGFRARGGWSLPLNDQQRKFLPFDLDSYREGALDIAIMPRPLFPVTERERIEIERLRVQLDNERAAQSGMTGIEQRIREMAR